MAILVNENLKNIASSFNEVNDAIESFENIFGVEEHITVVEDGNDYAITTAGPVIYIPNLDMHMAPILFCNKENGNLEPDWSGAGIFKPFGAKLILDRYEQDDALITAYNALNVEMSDLEKLDIYLFTVNDRIITLTNENADQFISHENEIDF